MAKQNDYLNKLADHCMLHISCMAGVVETKQNYTDIDDFRLRKPHLVIKVLLDFSLTVKAATLIFISGCGSAISSAKEGKSGFIYSLVKS